MDSKKEIGEEIFVSCWVSIKDALKELKTETLITELMERGAIKNGQVVEGNNSKKSSTIPVKDYVPAFTMEDMPAPCNAGVETVSTEAVISEIEKEKVINEDEKDVVRQMFDEEMIQKDLSRILPEYDIYEIAREVNYILSHNTNSGKPLRVPKGMVVLFKNLNQALAAANDVSYYAGSYSEAYKQNLEFIL